MANKYASSSMPEVLALHIPLTATVPTPALCVVTAAMGPKIAPKTDLNKILYIHTSPYNPMAWHNALNNCHLSCSFPNLVHDLTYGSPIGNPPPLMSTFLPQNLSSADLHPELIDQELVNKVAAGHMSGPFTLAEATTIFWGFFCCLPVGLVEKVPGDGNW